MSTRPLSGIGVGSTQTVIALYDLGPDDAHNVGRRRPDTHLLNPRRVATSPERTAGAQGLGIQA